MRGNHAVFGGCYVVMTRRLPRNASDPVVRLPRRRPKMDFVRRGPTMPDFTPHVRLSENDGEGLR